MEYIPLIVFYIILCFYYFNTAIRSATFSYYSKLLFMLHNGMS